MWRAEAIGLLVVPALTWLLLWLFGVRTIGTGNATDGYAWAFFIVRQVGDCLWLLPLGLVVRWEDGRNQRRAAGSR